MENKATVYKVVRNVNGVLMSAIQGPVTLAYRIGEPVGASDALPEGGPLAFSTFDAALSFAKFEAKLAYLYGRPEQFEVYEAIGEGVEPVQLLSRDMTVEWRRLFWQHPERFTGTDVFAAPRGTVVTRCLTLVRKVWEDHGEM